MVEVIKAKVKSNGVELCPRILRAFSFGLLFLLCDIFWEVIKYFESILFTFKIKQCGKWGWTNILFINNMAAPWTADACMVHTWSIAVEFQVKIYLNFQLTVKFYIVSPLIVLGMLAPVQWGAWVPFLMLLVSLFIRLIYFLKHQVVITQVLIC